MPPTPSCLLCSRCRVILGEQTFFPPLAVILQSICRKFQFICLNELWFKFIKEGKTVVYNNPQINQISWRWLTFVYLCNLCSIGLWLFQCKNYIGRAWYWSLWYIFSMFELQLAKILLLPPKYEIIIVPSNHSFFQYCNKLKQKD